MTSRAPDNEKTVATNRRARHDYHIEETFECGIALVGSEVKSLRAGRASLQESYAQVRNGEAFVYAMSIPKYLQASIQNHEPDRPRKLLLHRSELDRLRTKSEQQGYTIVPLRVYFKGHRVKVEIALARGKRVHDKRQTLIKKEHEREMARGVADARRRGAR